MLQRRRHSRLGRNGLCLLWRGKFAGEVHMLRLLHPAAILLSFLVSLPTTVLAQNCPVVPGRAANWCHPVMKPQVRPVPGNPYQQTRPVLQPQTPGAPRPSNPEYQVSPAPQNPYGGPAVGVTTPQLPLDSYILQVQSSLITCIPYDGSEFCTFLVPSEAVLPSGTTCHCASANGSTQ
jgi:hypothetical protein